METAKVAKRLAEIDDELQELKDQKKALSEERDKLEKQLKEDFSELGINNINIAGRTVYMHSQYWAFYKGDKQNAVEALKNNGLDQYVSETYNTQSLSAYFREKIREYEDEHDEPLMNPEDIMSPELRDELGISEKVQIRSRKAQK